MNLSSIDLHVILDAASRRMKVFGASGKMYFECEARNRTTADDGNYGHNSPCPPGEYLLGHPIPRDTVPFGFWFIPILDYYENHGMHDHGRSGIGLHGGGSGLSQPFASFQGWVVTHGCWRLQNHYMAQLAPMVSRVIMSNGRVYATVLAPTPGALIEPEVVDDYVDVPVDQLDPDE